MPEITSTTLARGIVAAVTAALIVGGTVGAGTATADDTENRSYPGCPLLLEGQRHSCVERLERDLVAVNPAYELTPDEFFGADTRVAVLDFQGQRRLPADGNVGGLTADALAREAEPPAPSEQCREGDRGQASELADRGFTTVQEQTLRGGAYEGLTVSIRASDTVPGCAWGLISAQDDPLSLEVHQVWVDRSLDGGVTWEKQPERTAGLFSGVTHTGVYDATAPASIRVCGVSYHQPLSAPSQEAQYEVPDQSPYVCTDWWTQR
ncbi:peptidoglycan-binding protein [Actinomycetospora rhizophila]|uniref:Peptidoglycan-binding protein n=1 Tax=Actinomycetospora rhizophila TaxID=1416876 RepID=A0ABV9ZN98_9PSEU